MLQIEVGSEDLVHSRFAISPLFELCSAIRTTHRPAGQRWHLPWLEQVMRRDPPAGLTLLQAMQPRRGYTPDFLAPTPSSPATTVYDEVDRVRQTPLAQVARELQLARTDARDAAGRAVLDDLLADPERALARVVQALQSCWQELLAPHWSRVRQLLERDIAYRAEGLAGTGLVHVLQDLHRDGTVQVDWRRATVHQHRDVGGAGLVLLPSAFTWPGPIAVLDPPWQPTVVYPARGVAALWHQPVPDPTAALAAVLGRTRARLLTDLAEPADTTSLAVRYGMAPSSVSRHLQVLHDAGLVSARRQRRCVLYQRTDLGTALARSTGEARRDVSRAAPRRKR